MFLNYATNGQLHFIQKNAKLRMSGDVLNLTYLILSSNPSLILGICVMATKYAAIFFGTVFISAASLTSAEPVRLSSSEMDSVTAGAISVTAIANASAVGINTIAQTSANTNVRSFVKNGVTVEIGYGVASAYACCSANTAATASTSATSDGKIVFLKQINSNNTTPDSTAAFSSIYIVSISPLNSNISLAHNRADYFNRSHEQRRDHFRQQGHFVFDALKLKF